MKHGDMDNNLASPSPSYDVHMGGLNFTCQECHVTDRHRISGSSTTSAVSEGVVACTNCHDSKPHDAASPLMDQLNDHLRCHCLPDLPHSAVCQGVSHGYHVGLVQKRGRGIN